MGCMAKRSAEHKGRDRQERKPPVAPATFVVSDRDEDGADEFPMEII